MLGSDNDIAYGLARQAFYKVDHLFRRRRIFLAVRHEYSVRRNDDQIVSGVKARWMNIGPDIDVGRQLPVLRKVRRCETAFR